MHPPISDAAKCLQVPRLAAATLERHLAGHAARLTPLCNIVETVTELQKESTELVTHHLARLAAR